MKGRWGVVGKLIEDRSNEGNLQVLCVCFHRQYSPYGNERWSESRVEGGCSRGCEVEAGSGSLSSRLGSALRSVTIRAISPLEVGAACKHSPSASFLPLRAQV